VNAPYPLRSLGIDLVGVDLVGLVGVGLVGVGVELVVFHFINSETQVDDLALGLIDMLRSRQRLRRVETSSVSNFTIPYDFKSYGIVSDAMG
tara:strand:+ start:849 stop:1124 length:276 start_codon:yes stop_codon:yes gene_type:complete